MVLRAGAFAATEGARKRMPVTCVFVVAMPRVAKGARRHAWNASTLREPSGMGFSCEGMDLREQVGRDAHPFACRALAVGSAPLSWQAHARILRHRGDEGLDALEEDLVPGERLRVHPEARLADARGLAFLGEEAVRLESEGGAGERAHQELHGKGEHRALHPPPAHHAPAHYAP